MTSRDDDTPKSLDGLFQPDVFDAEAHSEEEIAITEVSPQVLEELSQLFKSSSQHDVNNQQVIETDNNGDFGEKGNRGDNTDRDGNENADVDVDIDVEATIDDVEIVAQISDSTPMAEVVSIIDDPSVDADYTPAPRDPLLNPMSDRGDVLEISDDSGGAVVIVDDDVDRVIIVDQDQPDPRFEERQKRHLRRERLRKVKWFKLAGAVVVLVAVVLGVLASPLFAIRNVVFEGNVYTSQETINKVTELLEGASVFTADTRAAREEVLKDPWVSEVRITTDFPSGALVEVAERVPVVWYVGEDEKARVIDARGFIIAVLDGWPTRYLQVVGTGASLEAGTYADDVYRAAAQLVLALPDEIRGRVKSLELAGGGELTMILKEGTIVRFGPPTDLQNKLVAVVVLFRRQDPASLLVVDVSTGNPTVQTK